jgi:hypothetical protein
MWETTHYIVSLPSKRIEANYGIVVVSLLSILRGGLFMLTSLQSTNTENFKQIFPEKELRGHSLNFHILVSVSDLYIPMIDLPILLQEISGPILGIY